MFKIGKNLYQKKISVPFRNQACLLALFFVLNSKFGGAVNERINVLNFFIHRTLERSMNTTVTRVQDQISLLASLVRNGLRKEVWDFVVKNFDTFHER